MAALFAIYIDIYCYIAILLYCYISLADQTGFMASLFAVRWGIPQITQCTNYYFQYWMPKGKYRFSSWGFLNSFQLCVYTVLILPIMPAIVKAQISISRNVFPARDVCLLWEERGEKENIGRIAVNIYSPTISIIPFLAHNAQTEGRIFREKKWKLKKVMFCENHSAFFPFPTVL